jgi:hypothetical protein
MGFGSNAVLRRTRSTRPDVRARLGTAMVIDFRAL